MSDLASIEVQGKTARHNLSAPDSPRRSVIVRHGRGTLGSVLGNDGRINRSVVYQDIIEQVCPNVLTDDIEVVLEAEPVRLSGFRHEVGDIDSHGPDAGDRGGNASDKEIRQDAGVQATGTYDDRVGVDQRAQRLRERTDGALEGQALDWATPCDNGRLAVDKFPRLELGDEADVLVRGRQHSPSSIQHPTQLVNGDPEIACYLGERCKKKVPDRVAVQFVRSDEPVLQQAHQRRPCVNQCGQTVASVSRWENPEFAPQSSRAAAIVGDRDDGR